MAVGERGICAERTLVHRNGIRVTAKVFEHDAKVVADECVVAAGFEALAIDRLRLRQAPCFLQLTTALDVRCNVGLHGRRPQPLEHTQRAVGRARVERQKILA